jgi:hypothetical protein
VVINDGNWGGAVVGRGGGIYHASSGEVRGERICGVVKEWEIKSGVTCRK